MGRTKAEQKLYKFGVTLWSTKVGSMMLFPDENIPKADIPSVDRAAPHWLLFFLPGPG